MNPKVKIKGSMSDLKTPLASLKSLMEEQESQQVDKPDMYDLQEDDLKRMKEQGYGI